MLRRTFLMTILFVGLAMLADISTAHAQVCNNCMNGGGGYASAPNVPQTQAFGRQWAHSYNSQDWDRFYHYPYVYYPQNYWGNEYYRSSESLYYRYPMEMRIPVYNKQWHNYYPEGATWDQNYTYGYKGPPTGGRYHSGAQFIMDTF